MICCKIHTTSLLKALSRWIINNQEKESLKEGEIFRKKYKATKSMSGIKKLLKS
jgi:hypothetical protein